MYTPTPTPPPQPRRTESVVSSKRNPFNVGDAVIHPNSGRKGIVKDVNRKWVKFDVYGVTLPGNKRLTVRYAWRNLEMVMPFEQMVEKAKAMRAKAEAGNKPMARLGRWVNNIFSTKKTA